MATAPNSRRLLRITLGVIILAIACIALAPHAYFESKKKEAMQFCEGLAPLIDHVRQETGRCPDTIDTGWLAGKRIPSLIQLSDLYTCRGDTFDLHFRNPGDFWNDIWDYQCTQQKCVWFNYD